jgi:DNA-binding beta-propeller fold protein YncE
MRNSTYRAFLAGLLAAAMVGTTQASDDDWRGHGSKDRWHDDDDRSFRRVSTLANYRNNDNEEIGEETVSEIVAATKDGRTLVYTDSPLQQVGFVDITDPEQPLPDGKVGVGGEPTSVDVLGDALALVGVNTSASFTHPSGFLAVVDIATRTVIRTIDLGGQPDSLKISPDGRYVAVAIENERDEDITVGGVEGGLPQLPAGYLAIVDVTDPGDPFAWTRRDVDLTGLATYAPEDPEPEFVDINGANEAVVSLQENNHLVIVDLEKGEVSGHFPAGTVTLKGVDATEDGVIALTETLPDVPREPDGVTWLDGGHRGKALIGTANEGDLFGGSRGFSLFDEKGRLVFDTGSDFEEIAVRFGHYPEDRSENKGSEPEAIEYGRFGRDDYLFVASERGSFVAVYEMDDSEPEFKQVLPAPLGPEGLLAIPSRNLLVVSGEEDDPSFGVRSSIMIYRLDDAAPEYPQIASAEEKGSPIPWSALSGLVAVPGERDELLAVWDSYYSESRIFRIDASETPAVITEAMTIRGGSGNYDPEGIAVAPDGTLWVASEGNADDSRPNRLLQLDRKGNVVAEVGLPQAILDCRAASANTGTLGSGFEGVAVKRERRGYKLLVAQQRGWDYTTAECEDLDDDAGGLNAKGQPNRTRIWVYDPETGEWDHIAWELAPLPADASWVGLSEITATPWGGYVLIERDNRTGDFAALKTLVQVGPFAGAGGPITQGEKRVFDLIPALEANNGWITDKPEGFAIARGGKAFLVTDNDGVEDWSGETWFLELGPYRRLFR